MPYNSNEKEKQTCPICGKPTANMYNKYQRYGLCAEHSKQFNNNEIEKCPDCGKWHRTNEICSCKIDKHNQQQVEKDKVEKTKIDFDDIAPPTFLKNNTHKENDNYTEQKENKCLLCDNNSGKYLFCKECFSKYHGKTLLLKITVDKNQKLELLNESYEGVYTCKDGHIVKSKSERDIDNYLFEHKIAHAYEKALVLENGAVTLKPDFYLKDKDLYIEHWGYDESNKEYTTRKEYKLPLYKKAGITLIQTTEKDMQDVETSLEIKLKTYKKGEINPE